MPVGRNRFSGFPFRKGFRGLPGRGTWLQPKSWIKLQTRGEDFQRSTSAPLGRCWLMEVFGQRAGCSGNYSEVRHLTAVLAFNGLAVGTAENKNKTKRTFGRTTVVPGFLISNRLMTTEVTNQCRIKTGSRPPPGITPLISVNCFVLDRCEWVEE